MNPRKYIRELIHTAINNVVPVQFVSAWRPPQEQSVIWLWTLDEIQPRGQGYEVAASVHVVFRGSEYSEVEAALDTLWAALQDSECFEVEKELAGDYGGGYAQVTIEFEGEIK